MFRYGPWYHAALHTFFHSWQRKAGCVTLVMACVFAIGWVRSEFKFDNISIIREGTIESCFSVTQHLVWTSEPTNSVNTGMRWNSEDLIIGEDGLSRWNADRSDLPLVGLGLASVDSWAVYRDHARKLGTVRHLCWSFAASFVRQDLSCLLLHHSTMKANEFSRPM